MRIKLCEKSTPVQSVWADFEIRKHHSNSNKFIGYCRTLRATSLHTNIRSSGCSPLLFFSTSLRKNTLAREKVPKNALARQKMRLCVIRCVMMRYVALFGKIL